MNIYTKGRNSLETIDLCNYLINPEFAASSLAFAQGASIDQARP